MILEGWRDAIAAGRYAGVRYDCANAFVAGWINRLAKKVRLTAPSFVAAVQATAEEIAALSPVANDDEALPVSKPQPPAQAAPPRDQRVEIAPVRAAPRVLVPVDRPASPPEPPEATAERERLYRQLFEPAESQSRRRRRG